MSSLKFLRSPNKNTHFTTFFHRKRACSECNHYNGHCKNIFAPLYGMQIAKEEDKYSHSISQNWTFRQEGDSAVIISSVSKAVRFFHFCVALLTLLMMTAESVSKRPVLRFIVAVLFLFSLSLHRLE